jgi:DNA-directed RNA polymerase subunit H (RpoH/RPB5)
VLFYSAVEDPVRIFEHQPVPPHSVLKLFVDLFSNAKTAALFYTNDTKVLIDIIVRQLADLSPGDSVSFIRRSVTFSHSEGVYNVMCFLYGLLL